MSAKMATAVLTSPSRLQVRLLFTENRPANRRTIAILNHPPLPRIIDIPSVCECWSRSTLYTVIDALQYLDRVCRLAISPPITKSKDRKKLSEAIMDQPFMALESLELNCNDSGLSNIQPSFLSAQTPLRRLKVSGLTSTLLSQVLPHTTSVVDLTLLLCRISSRVDSDSFCTPLLGHLQDAFPTSPRAKHVPV